jgi:chromosome condensin MukBEF MukE localization factor
VAKLELQLRNARNDLEDAQAELKRLRTTATGSEQDKAAMQNQLRSEIDHLKYAALVHALRVC